MSELIEQLEQRRFKAFAAVLVIALAAIIVSLNINVTPLDYFGGAYNQTMIYGLFIYKLVELAILYYLLMYRHMMAIAKHGIDTEYFPKIQKHTKLLYFLIPQGNTVFGFIAYKLSGEIKFFLIFSLIALIALFIIKPNSLNVTLKTVKIR